MNYNVFFLLLNAVLVVRLILTFRDEGIRKSDILWIAIVPMVVVAFFSFGVGWITTSIFLILMSIFSYWLDKKMHNRYIGRILQFIIYFIGIAVLSSSLFQLDFHTKSIDLFSYCNEHLLPGIDMGAEEIVVIQVLLFGLLLILNEMNFLIRYLLHLLQLEPISASISPGKENVDDKEYNTGRVIGMLERIFVYVLILSGQFTAIGFILTAKGVVRFKELEDRTFAEYVLIGTFLSTLLAMLTALIIEKVILMI